MGDSTWLKNADNYTVVKSVHQYGPIAFQLGGLTLADVSNIAAKVINEQANKVDDLSFFFASTSDENKTVHYAFRHAFRKGSTDLDIVWLTKTTKHKHDAKPVIIECGPFVPSDKAQEICDFFNKLYGGE
jgi:hypothetical protein